MDIKQADSAAEALEQARWAGVGSSIYRERAAKDRADFYSFFFNFLIDIFYQKKFPTAFLLAKVFPAQRLLLEIFC
ncbi:hypothetical protein MA16_Dca004656 [Dendrobium catenatum]|uniref:Uncharacterized protein n=1 Tax=Dendrobium catenatum TaxID=906689 RepID=A0A2I0VNR1_9ASPA|nr:hypothetical protein MA16_Dca004656 [Dendrobium catenatum]